MLYSFEYLLWRRKLYCAIERYSYRKEQTSSYLWPLLSSIYHPMTAQKSENICGSQLLVITKIWQKHSSSLISFPFSAMHQLNFVGRITKNHLRDRIFFFFLIFLNNLYVCTQVSRAFFTAADAFSIRRAYIRS